MAQLAWAAGHSVEDATAPRGVVLPAARAAVDWLANPQTLARHLRGLDPFDPARRELLGVAEELSRALDEAEILLVDSRGGLWPLPTGEDPTASGATDFSTAPAAVRGLAAAVVRLFPQRCSPLRLDGAAGSGYRVQATIPTGGAVTVRVTDTQLIITDGLGQVRWELPAVCQRCTRHSATARHTQWHGLAAHHIIVDVSPDARLWPRLGTTT